MDQGLAVSPALAAGEGATSEVGPSGERTGSSLSSLESALVSEAEHLQSQEEAKGSSPAPEVPAFEIQPPSGASSVEGSPSTEGSGVSLLEDRLLPGLPIMDAEQVEAERQAKLASPEAVAAREESELKYSGLSAGEAAKALRETFPKAIEEPAGGPPQLPAGASITRFPAVNIAQVDGLAGKHSVIESTAPMAVQTMHGLTPIDLSLTEEGDAFIPKTPLVDVQIPKQLGRGVSLANTGVSVIPVDEGGAPLGGSQGSINGVTVMYANTQTDTDTLVKPTTSGFEMDTVLRSINSPAQLDYKVNLPIGATLMQGNDASEVEVVEDGTTVASLSVPMAQDAEGTTVPLSLELTSGAVIKVALSPFSEGRFRLPIVVDPVVRDRVFAPSESYPTEWHFDTAWPATFYGSHWTGLGEWQDTLSTKHGEGESGGLYYLTKNASQILRVHTEKDAWSDGGWGFAHFLLLETPHGLEDYDELPENTNERENSGEACAPELSCEGTKTGGALAENSNTAGFVQTTTSKREGSCCVSDGIWNAYVEVSQEKGPEVEFNKTSPTIYNSQTKEYVPNVLYGAGSWLGPHSGAFEVRAKDPGVGLSLYRAVTASWGDYKDYDGSGEDYCLGIQCPEYNDQGYTYKTGMSDGEESWEAFVEDGIGLSAHIYPQEIKVDATKPYGIKIIGLQNGNELPMGEDHLEVEATDGEGSIKSSGVKSIKVSVDGHEVSGSAASCPEGPCTASTKITLLSRDFTPGTHSMIVTATDNADNVAQEEFTFRVHGASPVSIGPGTVDPSDGQFALSSADVSLDGLSGVSRSYESRSPTAGANGPLGPEWTINLGGGEGLTARPNGNMILNAGGSSTTFTRTAKGEFESPSNSSSLKLEAKGTSEFVLSDSATGTKTKFEQPKETLSVTPTFVDQFGAQAGQLKHPISDAIDAEGNMWTVSNESDLIEKFSPTGTLLATYGSEGTGAGQYTGPWGIAIDPRNGNVYVSDQGNSRVEEFSSSGTFIKTFGWEVNNKGKDEFEICTKECKAGIAGSGNGQFSTTAGIAVDSSGNVWVADFGNNRIEEFNEKGEYLRKFGSKGTGNEQFEGPTDIALSGGNLYITDYRNDRVQEFSTLGTHLGKFGEAGSENGKFSSPYGIAADPNTGNLYVVDSGNHRVQEFSAAGTFITKFGSSGTGPGQFTSPQGIAVSGSGRIYVVDNGADLIDEWARPVWLPAESGGPLAATATTYTYTTVEEEEKAVVEPKEALAPTPAGVSSCTPLVAGCRALTFEYAKETTAKGENPNEWGNYKGHLEKVWFHGYSTTLKEITKIEVARYEYDGKGRLRVEWDPRLEHPLKTTYGYDAEGHVTSLTPPGQQPWTFVYGTIAGDSNTGRMLKVTRAHPKASWSEEKVKEKLEEQALLPKNKEGEAPSISGTPAVGVRLAASNGEWSDSPVVYGYQWEDCTSSGGECTPILGATNQNYTPVSTDVGHKLVVNVTAVNGGGAVAVSSAASAAVVSKPGMFEQSVDSGYSLNAVSCIPSTTDCVLSDSAGKALYATNVSSSSEATWKTWSGPSGESPSQAVDCPTTSLCLLADGKETAGGKLYYATSLGGAFSEAYSPTYGVDAISCVSSSFCVSGQDNFGYFHYSTSPASTSWTLEDQGETSMKGVFCLSSSFCAIADSDGRVHVATSTSQVESSSWTETDVDGSSAIHSIACTSTTSCVAVDGAGNALKLAIESSGAATASKHNIDGTTSLTAVTCSGSSTCVAVDNAGNVFVSKNSGESWAKEYALGDKLTSVSCASSSLCATVDTTGNVTAFNPAGGTGVEGESHGPQPGTTIEYDVPSSGSGAPYSLSKEEVEKWAQKDDPVEGAAIFPPDEAQTWPASSYKRAVLHYWDARGRTVNTVIPTGGVSTSEYDEANETIRTLSADNRAASLKEGCKSVLKKECLAAEVSEKLDTKTVYNPEEAGIQKETNIVKVIGPEHKIKLSTGEEFEARSITHDYYNEGAKEAEEKNKETYDQLTKTTSGALLSTGEEKDTRTTVMSYSGQKELGWKLRKPTSVTDEPGGLNLTTTTVYQEETGNVIETRSAKGSVSGSPAPPTYDLQFGEKGSGNGQFSDIADIAFNANGDEWVVDNGNDRVEEFSPEGAYLAGFGSKGTGNGQFTEPYGIAINPGTGNIYVGDDGNYRIQEFSAEGKFVRAFGSKGTGNGQFEGLLGIALDSAGDVWAVDEADNRVEELSPEGTFIKAFGTKGSGKGQFKSPNDIAYSAGHLYVSDFENYRIEEFSTAGTYIAEFGSKGSGNGQFEGVYGIAADPVSGNLYVSDGFDHRVEEFSPTGTFITKFGTEGKGAGQLESPIGIAVNGAGSIYVGDFGDERIEEWELVPSFPAYTSQLGSKGKENGQMTEPRAVAQAKNGNVLVLDSANGRVEEFTPAGKYETKFGSYGTGTDQLLWSYAMALDSKGNIWIADTGNNRVDEFNEKHEFVQAFGWGVNKGEAKLEVCTTSCKAGTAGEGTGQLHEPKGIAVTASGNVYVTDSANNRMEEFYEKGEFIAAFGFKVNESGKEEFEICTNKCKAGTAGVGNGQFDSPRSVAIAPNGDIWVADSGSSQVEEFSEKNEYLSKFGEKGSGRGQLKEPKGVAVDPAGNVWVSDGVNDNVQEFTSAGKLLTVFGDKGTGNGQFEEPWGIAFAANGTTYIADVKNNRMQKWTSAPRPGSEGAHDTKTIYYTAKEEAEVSTCRNHPEWAGLICQTEPDAQPGISASPGLPITTITSYNMWEDAEKISEVFTRRNAEGKEEKVTRTKTQTYDAAGRALTSQETSSPAHDTALPTVTNEYNTETGALEKQCANEGKPCTEGKPKTITSKDNTLGQLVEYTDAEGNITRYTYEEGRDGRLNEVSEGKGEEAKSSQTYTYNTTTGFVEKLVDIATGMGATEGTFAASYDVEGKMVSEIYPNGMCANTIYDSVGEATGLEYIKTRNCSEKEAPVWFSDSISPSIHGETLQQTSTLAKEKYTYDNAGRLVEVQETLAGKGCASGLYAYDEESNRTSLTTRESATETCATEGGVVQNHFYDSANHLIDGGAEYETFGNMTKLPAIDAGEHEIVSTYYVDNQVATQTQNEQLNAYTYDPAGRVMNTVSENEKTKTKSTLVNHYAGASGTLSWTCQEEGKAECTEEKGKWARNIPGIEGGLAAIQEEGKSPILQLHDLQGNIIATAEDNESATKLISAYNSTAFGVPQAGTAPPKYAWLGAEGVSSEPLQAAGTTTEGGDAYVPEIGRPLQAEPIATPGEFPNGTGGVGRVEAPWVGASAGQLKEIAAREGAVREETKKREAEERAKLTERPSSETQVDGPGEGNCEANCWINEEEYYYEQAQTLAEASEQDQENENATSASFKLRLSEGCLDVGFWTYCSGQYHGKWYYNKVASNSPYNPNGVPTGIRVAGAVTGAVVFVAGGGAMAGCLLAAGTTPEDGQIELVPLELHCIGTGAGAMLAGGVVFLDSLGL